MLAMQMESKTLAGVARIEPSPELEQVDVSNEVGAAVGSAEFTPIKVKWLYDTIVPFDRLIPMYDVRKLDQDVEVGSRPRPHTRRS